MGLRLSKSQSNAHHQVAMSLAHSCYKLLLFDGPIRKSRRTGLQTGHLLLAYPLLQVSTPRLHLNHHTRMKSFKTPPIWKLTSCRDNMFSRNLCQPLGQTSSSKILSLRNRQYSLSIPPGRLSTTTWVAMTQTPWTIILAVQRPWSIYVRPPLYLFRIFQ